MTTIKIKEFEEYCQEQLGLSKHSLRAYRQDLSAFAKFRAKVGLVEQPSGADVIAFQKDLREEQSASPSTIRRRLVTLRSYYKWREGVCPEEPSPFEGLRLDLKIPKRLPRPVDRPTLSALFQSTEHIIDLAPVAGPRGLSEVSATKVTGLIARLLVVTGLRISELTELRVQDVTGAATRISVSASHGPVSGPFVT